MEVSQVTQPRLNTLKDVQERLGISSSLLFRLLASGELPSVKLGRRRMVTEAQLCQFIDSLSDSDGENSA